MSLLANHHAELTQECARILAVPSDDVRLANIESEFHWLPPGEIVWGLSRSRQSVVLWLDGSGQTRWINGPEAMSRISELLTAGGASLTESYTPVQLANTIRRLTVAPPGFVGHPDFLGMVSTSFSDWLQRDEPDQRLLFAAHCENPRLIKESSGLWRLEFSYFTPAGGVERWQVQGDPTRIISAEFVQAQPDGTFRWPMA